MPMTEIDLAIISCSFCGKTQKEVEFLITGPNVYICKECIELCRDILEELEIKSKPSSYKELKAENERMHKQLAGTVDQVNKLRKLAYAGRVEIRELRVERALKDRALELACDSHTEWLSCEKCRLSVHDSLNRTAGIGICKGSTETQPCAKTLFNYFSTKARPRRQNHEMHKSS